MGGIRGGGNPGGPGILAIFLLRHPSSGPETGHQVCRGRGDGKVRDGRWLCRGTGEEERGAFQPGFLCYGVPVGVTEYTHSQLREKAEKIVTDARKVSELLARERQALWVSLK